MSKYNKGAGAKAPATPETLEAANEIIAQLNATIKEKDEVIAEQSEEITRLEKLVVVAQNAGVMPVTVEVDGKTYIVNHGARIDNLVFTKEELAENADVCKKILALQGQETLTLKED